MWILVNGEKVEVSGDPSLPRTMQFRGVQKIRFIRTILKNPICFGYPTPL